MFHLLSTVTIFERLAYLHLHFIINKINIERILHHLNSISIQTQCNGLSSSTSLLNSVLKSV